MARNDFTDLDRIRARPAAFEGRRNAVAGPFNRRFTRTDLDDLLERIGTHETHHSLRHLA